MLALLATRSYPPMYQASSSNAHQRPCEEGIQCTVISAHTSMQRLAEQVRRDGPRGSNPATCSKRDGHEMALPSSGESVGGGEADGQRRARWAACTHGVRASAVMLHGIPAGVHAPGGRARSAGGAVDEPRAAAQQRRRRRAKQHYRRVSILVFVAQQLIPSQALIDCCAGGYQLL